MKKKRYLSGIIKMAYPVYIIYILNVLIISNMFFNVLSIVSMSYLEKIL